MTATIIDMSQFASTQSALDSVVRNTIDGDVLEYPTDWDETISTDLDFTSYGTPTNSAPLQLRGLGNAKISLAGAKLFPSQGKAYTALDGLDVAMSGGSYIWGFANDSNVRAAANGCRFSLTSTSDYISYNRGINFFKNCVFTGSTSRSFRDYHLEFDSCVFDGLGLYTPSMRVTFANCLFINTKIDGALYAQANQCTFVGPGSGTAIRATARLHVRDSIFKNWSTGIDADSYGAAYRNKFFGCTNRLAGNFAIDEDNTEASSDPLTIAYRPADSPPPRFVGAYANQFTSVGSQGCILDASGAGGLPAGRIVSGGV